MHEHNILGLNGEIVEPPYAWQYDCVWYQCVLQIEDTKYLVGCVSDPTEDDAWEHIVIPLTDDMFDRLCDPKPGDIGQFIVDFQLRVVYITSHPIDMPQFNVDKNYMSVHAVLTKNLGVESLTIPVGGVS